MRLAVLFLGLTLAAGPAFAQSPGHVPEPGGLWQGMLHGYTPNTVKGAEVIGTQAFEAILARDTPVLIDVAEPDKRPENMPASALWMPAHRSIPGAHWLPGAGSGTSDPGFADAFAQRAAALTGEDKARAVVVFCHPDCWGSWNAAKRLARLGYTRVFWYPEGMEGWQSGHDTVFVKADPAWAPPHPAEAVR